MRKCVCAIETMAKRIVADLEGYPYRNAETFNAVFAAYNRWCEDENNGNGYIFNINNHNDLAFMVKSGMTAKSIAEIYNDSQTKTSGCFFHDENHFMSVIDTWEEIRDLLINMIKDVLCEDILLYVTRCKEYQKVYEMYVTDVCM